MGHFVSKLETLLNVKQFYLAYCQCTNGTSATTVYLHISITVHSNTSACGKIMEQLYTTVDMVCYCQALCDVVFLSMKLFIHRSLKTFQTSRFYLRLQRLCYAVFKL
jgi:hypothetical protein